MALPTITCTKCASPLGGMASRAAFLCFDVAGDEHTHSLWCCPSCSFYTLEIHRDRFMGSDDATIGGPITPDEGESWVDRFRRCPEPNNKRCPCAVHAEMGPHSVPRFADPDEIATDAPAFAPIVNEAPLSKCPMCLEETDSLKRYKLLTDVVFIGIGASVRPLICTACPRCMRTTLLRDTFSPLTLLKANLMWPLVVVPYACVLFFFTLLTGHSKSVKKVLDSRR